MAPSRRSQTAFLFLPFLLPALTNAVALSDFEALPSSVTSPSCVSAYQSPIANCQPSDFQNGAQCSPNCVVGIYVKATEITNQCGSAVTSSTSLLAIAFEGQLGPKLCHNLVDGSSSSTPAATQPTATTTSTTPISTKGSVSSPSSSTPTTTTTPTSASSSIPSSTPSLSSTPSPSSSSSSSSSSGGIAYESAPAPVAGPNGFSTSATFIGSGLATSAIARPTDSTNGGGGSPFEFSGAMSSRTGLSTASLIAAVGCSLFLLLR